LPSAALNIPDLVATARILHRSLSDPNARPLRQSLPRISVRCVNRWFPAAKHVSVSSERFLFRAFTG
jgi:hypothetical protein